ncbi:MAG: Gldg family protein [Gammaproteobacteria bacterium]|nr:Gldg family protein [Gammaproteobacteria bacterium]
MSDSAMEGKSLARWPWDTVGAIVRKELALFFGSPIGYLFLLAYLGVTLFVFFWGEAFFARNIADVRPMFEWLPILLVFLAAALTMRMWSEERRIGTLEFVVTVPASAWQFAAGKFLACWALLAVALALTLPLAVTVAFLGDLDWGPVFAGYVAALLLGAAYLSIGLFVSAKTDNQIVALILATFSCGVFYLVGSPFIAELFDNEVGDVLRALGAGSRFESITRGVLDLGDLYYYVSIVGVFLALNVYAIESHGWADDGPEGRHRNAQRLTALVALNFIAANFWLAGFGALRWDVTEGRQFSISDATRSYLSQLQEPLLVRGYFSNKTHPLLAPLVPEMRDLLTEYEVAADGRLRLELVDPATAPDVEDEANSKYGIRPVPFQVADRYQSSLVSSYFDVLVQYGDEYEVLDFRDLIEVKVTGESDLDVRLRNPEYDLTRAIKKVLYGFRGGGDVFDAISEPVAFTGYISRDERLPAALVDLKGELDVVLDELIAESDGKFTPSIHDPDAGDGALASEIEERYGFTPMAASLFDLNTFYYYLTLSDGETVVQVPIPESLDADGLRRGLLEGLKRFAEGVLKKVAVHLPPAPNPYMQQQMPVPPGDQFENLRSFLAVDFDIATESLDDGDVGAGAGVLLVVDPGALGEKEVFAIDQFLMRGGTVVVAVGAFEVLLSPQSLTSMARNSGLDDWLAHHGVVIDKSFVMDAANSAFPVPVRRQVGGFSFQELVMLDYPYFVDVRDGGLNQDFMPTSELPQVTFAWGSPVDIDGEANADRAVTALLESSAGAWRSTSTDVMPSVGENAETPFVPTGDVGVVTLAGMIEGRFDSFFEESPLLAGQAEDPVEEDGAAADGGGEGDAATDAEDEIGAVTSVIGRSPESARLVVIGSSSFLADQTLAMIGSADGTRYANSVQFIANLVDWAVEDQALLSIRGRGHFNRTLAPIDENAQRVWEYANYAVAVLAVFGAFVLHVAWRARRRRRQTAWLGAAS